MATQKHQDFVTEPVGDKSVKLVPGIGDKLGARLIRRNITHAYELVGQFLALKKNKEDFKDWLMSKCGGDDRNWDDCYNAIDDWCKTSM